MYVYSVICFLVVVSLFRQQKLQFRPPIEEIRAKYYRDMKKFINIPLLFRGVSEISSHSETIFHRLINRNAKSLLTVYKKVCTCTCNYYFIIHVHVHNTCTCICIVMCI